MTSLVSLFIFDCCSFASTIRLRSFNCFSSFYLVSRSLYDRFYSTICIKFKLRTFNNIKFCLLNYQWYRLNLLFLRFSFLFFIFSCDLKWLYKIYFCFLIASLTRNKSIVFLIFYCWIIWLIEILASGFCWGQRNVC